MQIHAVTLLYATVAIAGIVMTEINNKNLLTATFVQRATGKKVKASYRVIFQVGLCNVPHTHLAWV